jgi:hypothetical protein
VSLPGWATRLYKTAPRRAIISVERPGDIGGNLHQTHLVTLECGHRTLVKLRREQSIEDDRGVPQAHQIWVFVEARCRVLLPAQRCKECQERRYPELRRLEWNGRYEEYKCSKTDIARLEAHENGEHVPPVE